MRLVDSDRDYAGRIRQLKRDMHAVVDTLGRVTPHTCKGTKLKLDALQCMGFIDDVNWSNPGKKKKGGYKAKKKTDRELSFC